MKKYVLKILKLMALPITALIGKYKIPKVYGELVNDEYEEKTTNKNDYWDMYFKGRISRISIETRKERLIGE